MKTIRIVLLFILPALLFSSCMSSSHSMKSVENRIEFVKNDFEFSDQVSGEATQVKIFGIDWARLFDKKWGEISGSGYSIEIPVIGAYLSKGVNSYAVFNMIKDNPGYDVVMYPQFESRITNLIIMKATKVKVTARLGRIKK